MTPFASVAMLEKLALLKIALCRAPALSSASACRTFMLTSVASGMLLWTIGICSSFHLIPTLYYDRCRQQWGCQPRMRIALEVGTHSPWVSRLLKELGHEVLVANPRKPRLAPK